MDFLFIWHDEGGNRENCDDRGTMLVLCVEEEEEEGEGKGEKLVSYCL